MRRPARPALARAALAAALLAATAGRAHAGKDFDHLFHDGQVVTRGGGSVACGVCHATDGRDRPAPPGHGACFASGCHAPPRKGAPAPGTSAEVCLVCHDSATPGRRARATPPADPSPDFGLRFDHRRHADTACEACHRDAEARPARTAPSTTHDRCGGCHSRDAGAAPPITACKGCHPPVAGRVVAPRLVPGPYAVGATFSHATHLARVPSGGDRCLVCHEGVRGAAGEEVPPPTMASCEICHDGRAAFAALGPTCTRCHSRGDPRALAPAAPPVRFGHAAHAARGLAADCATCHALAPDGAPRPASADHAPCADAACHAAEFRSPAPRLCGGCHVGTEPWRPLRADVPRRPFTEFGVEFSHAAHLGGPAPRDGRPCEDCHVGVRGGPEMRLGLGHAACAGAGCHATAGGPVPGFGDCAGCHRPGLLEARDRRRRTDRWSVAGQFRHEVHLRDGPGAPVACASCHDGVLQAATVAAIPAPRKPTCAGCHDGTAAFKMTGHGCARCHAPARR